MYYIFEFFFILTLNLKIMDIGEDKESDLEKEINSNNYKNLSKKKIIKKAIISFILFFSV